MYTRPPFLVDKLSQINEKLVPELFLVDVGVSGGIDSSWRAWGSKLSGVGFDPLVNEIDRLNLIEKNKNIRYHSAYVIGPEMPEPNSLYSHMSRSSARALCNYEANHITDSFGMPESKKEPSFKHFQDRFNHNQELIYSQDKVVLDDYLSTLENTHLMLKTDTDGFDLQVLLGCKNLISKQKPLLLQVEAVFGTKNNFSEIDLFLTKNGYILYDCIPHRYSRKHLPAQFCHHIAAQTKRGPVAWADCLWGLDVVPDYNSSTRSCSPEEKLQLALLLDIYNLGDCSAEIIIQAPDLPLSASEKDLLLNFLAKKYTGYDSYREYQKHFWEHPYENHTIPQRVKRKILSVLKKSFFIPE